MFFTRQRAFLNVLATIVLLAMSELALAAAGKVLFVSGPVSVERNGTRPLNKGDAIEVGDVIMTGDKARAQILMADGAKIALRAGTRFRIDEFTLPPSVTAPAQATVINANGKSVASLLKGGFRTQTGTIGSLDRAAYEVRTPIGTLGIRGTDYTAVFCVGDCIDAPGLQPGQVIRDGLYLGVTEGGIQFVGGGRQIALNAGQYAFVPLSGARPEPLQTAPAFLEADGAGPLDLGGGRGDTAKSTPAAGAEMGEFNDRRSPSDTSTGESGRDTSKPDVDQPIIGTGPNGQPIDVTGGSLPSPRQNLSFGVGGVGQSSGFDASVRDFDTAFTTDAAGNLTAFGGPLEGRTGTVPAQYAIGTSANTDTGSSAATGLRWGRWNTGTATITASGSTTNVDLAQQSLHWILGQAGLDVALPISGTATYTLVGGTQPTDTRGNAGAIGGAFLAADFTNLSVTSTVSLDIDQVNWFATGTAPLTANSNLFSANFATVNIGGVLAGSGSFSGFFEAGASASGQPPGGAGIAYTLADPQLQRGIVSGVLALAQGAGQPPPPPAPQRRDLTYAILQLPVGGQVIRALENAAADYALDPQFNLARFLGILPRDPDTQASYQIGTSTVAESNVDSLTLLRWGRWAGGDINIVEGATTLTQSLAQQSLHWIETGNAGAPPVMPTTGTATYTLIGSTSPTDALGNVGVLGAATFVADFTNQVVDSTLDLTIAGQNWVMTAGRGSIGAQAGVLPHQFGGGYTGFIDNPQFPAFGSYTGFFSQPGSTVAGVPGGVGLSYVLNDAQGLASVTGTAVFRGP